MTNALKARPVVSVLVLVAGGVLVAPSAHAVVLPLPGPPYIAASGYILEDVASGQVIAQNKIGEKIQPAGLTKLMTLYIVFDALKSGQLQLNNKVVISKKAWRTPGSRMFIRAGSRISVRNLIRGVIVDGGNDAAVALAQYVAGGESTFVHYMNQVAARLGLKHTHFANSSGLPGPDNYTSAGDLATLARDLIRRYPQYLHFFSEKSMKWSGIRQYNHNQLLWRDPSVWGLSTGQAKQAGYSLVAVAKRKGMQLIAVVIHAGSETASASADEELLNYGYRFYRTHEIEKADADIKRLKVWKGSRDGVPIGVLKSVYVTVPRRGYGTPLSTEISTHSQIVAPVKKGEALGTLKIMERHRIVKKIMLRALLSIKRGSWYKQLWDSVILFFAAMLHSLFPGLL